MSLILPKFHNHVFYINSVGSNTLKAKKKIREKSLTLRKISI